MTHETDSGFSIVELLVSMALMLVVTGAIFWLVDPGQSIARAQPEAADMQQRLRVGADLIQKDLMMAGAGTYSGAIAGSLANFFPPIMPYRTGATAPDPEMSYFSDRITISYVPNTAAQTTVRDAMPQPSSEIKVDAEPGCPVGDPLCGFHEGMRVVIFDDTGAYDFFTITHVQEDSLHLQHRPPNPDFSKAYSPVENARIAMLETHIYYRDAATTQLRHYDGWLTDLPIADNAVGVEFRYFGDPNPPLYPQPLVGQSNCILDVAGNPKLPTLASGGASIIELPGAMLRDGPVCGLPPNQFDADLYRIRKVSVRLRMQAGLADLRGRNPAGWTLFTNPGQSSSVYRNVPDFEMSYEVAPRNLNLAR
jgi:hypothetical protein